MYDLHLTAEQVEMREAVRDFVAREIKPMAAELDRREELQRQFPPALFDQASQLGLRTLGLPAEFGGAGADSLTICIVAEELAVGDVGVAAMLTETSTLARLLFDGMLSDEQRAQWMPEFLSDHRCHLAFAGPDSEPSDDWFYHRPFVADGRCPISALKAANGDWLLNGVQNFVPNAPVAKLIIVEAAAADGPRTLLVACNTRGLEVRAHDPASRNPGADGEPVFAWNNGTSGQLVFRDCRVPAKNLIASAGTRLPDRGGKAADRAPPHRAAMNLGVGRAAYEAALEYAKLRVQGGRRIIEHQAIGTMLAEMVARLETARSVIWQAAWAADHADAYADGSLPHLPHATIARIMTAEFVHKVTLDAAQIFGGSGVMRDLPMQKHVRAGMIFLHSNVSNSAAKFRLAEAVAGYERPSPAAGGR